MYDGLSWAELITGTNKWNVQQWFILEQCSVYRLQAAKIQPDYMAHQWLVNVGSFVSAAFASLHVTWCSSQHLVTWLVMASLWLRMQTRVPATQLSLWQCMACKITRLSIIVLYFSAPTVARGQPMCPSYIHCIHNVHCLSVCCIFIHPSYACNEMVI